MKGLTRKQILYICGTAGAMALLLGVYGFFIQRRYANLANYVITLFGFALTMAGFLYALQTSGTDRSRHETVTFPSTPNPKPVPPSPATQKDRDIPATYGLAFLASAVLTFIGTFMVLSSGVYFTNQAPYIQNVEDKYAVLIVAACVLRVIGLPGFHALQSTKAHYASLFGCIIWAIASVTVAMYLWGLASGSNIYQALQSYHELNIINNVLVIFSSIPLAIAIIRARVFPRWTAYLILLNAINSFWWIAGADNGGVNVETIQRLDSFMGSIILAVFAFHMLKRQPLTNFGTFRNPS